MDIRDVNASFSTHHKRAEIVLNNHTTRLGRIVFLVALVNRQLNNPDVNRDVKELLEEARDIAEVIDGFRNDVINLLEIQVQEWKQHQEKYIEVVARCDELQEQIKQFTHE